MKQIDDITTIGSIDASSAEAVDAHERPTGVVKNGEVEGSLLQDDHQINGKLQYISDSGAHCKDISSPTPSYDFVASNNDSENTLDSATCRSGGNPSAMDKNDIKTNGIPIGKTSTRDLMTNNILPYQIGGPNTSLPIVVESFLGWSLCLSCLAVSGYHYCKSILLSSNWFVNCRRNVQRTLRRFDRHRWISQSLFHKTENESMTIVTNHYNTQAKKVAELSIGATNDSKDLQSDGPWIPLTTHSRAEIDKSSPWERYLCLVQVLEKCHPDALLPYTSQHGSCNENKDEEIADNALIKAIRYDDICRRLASLAMRPFDVTIATTTEVTTISKITDQNNCNNTSGMVDPIETKLQNTTTKLVTTSLAKQHPNDHLLQRMSKLWHHFLLLPSLEECRGHSPHKRTDTKSSERHPFLISLILPAFHEDGSHLIVKLRKALNRAYEPRKVEVVIVDAGGCTNLDSLIDASEKSSSRDWGCVKIVSFTSGGGRGPCLNFGASTASGRILTFCHSDTALPHRWDERIVSTLEHEGVNDLALARSKEPRANSCAFSFGIDQSREGLSMPFASSRNLYYPPGIRAVETTANMRTHLYSLPYGDQVISLHSCVFHFLGGFPDQCLMEDYELVSLLRRRSALFKPCLDDGVSATREILAIIPGPPALCSPRRWQKFGVLYVTFMNSRLVNLYAGVKKLSPDDLFRLYYSSDPPIRGANDSPWEIRLAHLVKTLESNVS